MKQQNERGITLVALIITIIILIILAAVTIISVSKTNMVGIATKGTENYAVEQVNEIQKLDETAKMLEEAVKNIVDMQESKEKTAKFSITRTGEAEWDREYEISEGTTWREFLRNIEPSKIGEKYFFEEGNSHEVMFYWAESTPVGFATLCKLEDETGKIVLADDKKTVSIG